MSYLPLIDLKNGFWPVVHLLYRISEWNFTDMLNIKGYIFLVRTVTLTFPVHELSALDWSEKWFLTCSSFTIWSIWMKLHRYVDHQRLHIVTKDVISLSISVLLLYRHYISHKITFGAPSSGGVLRSACGAFITSELVMLSVAGRANQRSNSNISDLLSGPTFSVSINLMISFLLFSVLPWWCIPLFQLPLPRDASFQARRENLSFRQTVEGWQIMTSGIDCLEGHSHKIFGIWKWNFECGIWKVMRL